MRVSKKLSYILRHGAEKDGVPMGSDGFVILDDLLSRPDFKGLDLAKIQEIVDSNDKKRFEMIQRED